MKDFSQKVLSDFVRKLGIVSLMAICFALFSSNVSAQTTIVNYNFNNAASGTPCSPGTSSGVVASVFTTSTGTCTAPTGTTAAAPPAFTAAPVAGLSVSITNATTTQQYFQFQLNNVASFSNYMVFFQALRSSTGPPNGVLQYSLDGVTFVDARTFAVPTTFGALSFDLSGITALNNQPTVYFRVAASGASGTTGTFRIDNFQVQAIGPTAAGATISGRITSTNGRGIRNVRIMLVGGSLTEPIYATSMSFGHYQFSEVPTGETYVLQVFSKNYIFDSSSMVINLTEDLTETNFTGQLRGLALTGR
ncbi:MAG: carboxypeptidase regulatory-like domain-containing protein [Acidobacteria bacterium]|jgi:hypothetical protein|nr:carboxypeptidase regulatory-like domain-containing protein [Acidobacteriota bacterium]